MPSSPLFQVSLYDFADYWSLKVTAESVHLQACHRDRCLHHDVYQVCLMSVRSFIFLVAVNSRLSTSGMIFFSALYYLPQFFQVALAYSPIRSGVFLLPVLVSQTVASFVAVCNFLYTIPWSTNVLRNKGQIISKTGRYRVCLPCKWSSSQNHD